MLKWGGRKSSLLTILSLMYLLDIHVEKSSLELSREEGYCIRHLYEFFWCSRTHLTQEPLHICSASVWAPTNFL